MNGVERQPFGPPNGATWAIHNRPNPTTPRDYGSPVNGRDGRTGRWRVTTIDENIASTRRRLSPAFHRLLQTWLAGHLGTPFSGADQSKSHVNEGRRRDGDRDGQTTEEPVPPAARRGVTLVTFSVDRDRHPLTSTRSFDGRRERYELATGGRREADALPVVTTSVKESENGPGRVDRVPRIRRSNRRVGTHSVFLAANLRGVSCYFHSVTSAGDPRD